MTPSVSAAAFRLRVDAVTAEVLEAFASEDLPSILLKGVSVTRWLHGDGRGRAYMDCDLLVAPDALSSAGRILRELGFAPGLEEGDMPAWWREHAVEWVRAADGGIVDLHRSIAGVGVSPERLWEVLSRQTVSMEVGGRRAKVLTIPGRALQLALHAAHHGEWEDKQADLARAISQESEETWRRAADLAEQVEAVPAFAAGLRLVASGAELADRLELPRERPTELALRASSPPPVALGIDQLARASGLAARVAIVRHKVVPPPAFVRHWFPPARRGVAGLVLGYLWRPVWLALRAPAGLRAWLRAR